MSRDLNLEPLFEEARQTKPSLEQRLNVRAEIAHAPARSRLRTAAVLGVATSLAVGLAIFGFPWDQGSSRRDLLARAAAVVRSDRGVLYMEVAVRSRDMPGSDLEHAAIMQIWARPGREIHTVVRRENGKQEIETAVNGAGFQFYIPRENLIVTDPSIVTSSNSKLPTQGEEIFEPTALYSSALSRKGGVKLIGETKRRGRAVYQLSTNHAHTMVFLDKETLEPAEIVGARQLYGMSAIGPDCPCSITFLKFEHLKMSEARSQLRLVPHPDARRVNAPIDLGVSQTFTQPPSR